MPGRTPRHHDQATSVAIHDVVADELDRALERQLKTHRDEPDDATRREMIAGARLWAAQEETKLPEHGGRGEPVHEELLDEPEPPPARALPRRPLPLPPPPDPRSADKPGRNGTAHG